MKITACGYCGEETDKPCFSSKDAMNCSKDLKQPDRFTMATCDWCDKDVPLACIYFDAAQDCHNWPANKDKPKSGIPTEDWGLTEKPKMGGPGTPGYKADEGKARMDLIPPELLFAVASILTFGAKKYSDRNWEAGMKWGRCFGAAMRHLWAWWGGGAPTSKSFLFGELDNETGFSHLWHAGCCIAFLIAYEARGTGEDDRHKETK